MRNIFLHHEETNLLKIQQIDLNMRRGDEESSPEVNEVVSSKSQTQCFYTLCSKSYIFSYVLWGKFNDQKHSLYCYMITLLITALLIAIIGPLVSLYNMFYSFSVVFNYSTFLL
jgi:hypothetical protein